jgi:hypothetical protein
MAKGSIERGSKRNISPAANRAPKKKTAAAKRRPKGARRAAPSHDIHHAVFRSLTARSNQHNKPPVCYNQLANGYVICYLQSDGTYAQCQPYNGPTAGLTPCG